MHKYQIAHSLIEKHSSLGLAFCIDGNESVKASPFFNNGDSMEA